MAKLIQVFLLFLLLQICLTLKYKSDACLKRKTPSIPSDHLFHKKKQPLVFGHRGQGKIFQENTMDGLKSLIDLGADGFETDVVLTDYNQLVVFHSDNAEKLTGKNKLIRQMNSTEIKALKYKKKLAYGSQTYTYSKERPVQLLEDLFKTFKDSNLIIDLEMKPMTWDNLAKSNETGKAVAKLIKQFGLEKKVLLTSLDPFKLLAAKKENPNLVTGSYFLNGYWTSPANWYKDVKTKFKTLPGLETCLDSLPSNSSLMDFLFETGSTFKSVNASFIEFHFGLFSNTSLMKNPVMTIRDSYNKDITFGSSTIYNLGSSEAELKAAERKVDNLIKQSVARLITDDVPRLLKKLGRNFASKTNVSLLIVSVACFLPIYINF